MCVLQSCSAGLHLEWAGFKLFQLKPGNCHPCPSKVEDLSQTLPLRKHYSQKEGDVMTLFNSLYAFVVLYILKELFGYYLD
jgi:hypothetical protein